MSETKQFNKRILIMAGGTGGHIIPALAVANLLRQQQFEIHWLGTRAGLEQQLVPATNIPIHYINVQGLRGKRIKNLLFAPIHMLRSLYQASKVIKQLQPDLVIGFGGFVSGPGGLAAWLLRKPLVIHEQNSIAGFTNRCLAKLAKLVLQAFPQTFPAHNQAVTVGNPVRHEIVNLPMPEQRLSQRTGPLNILVLGGSQGANIFNQVLPQALAQLPERMRPHIWHAAGKKLLSAAEEVYRHYQVPAQVVGFIDDMSLAYSWADLVICRAGALTVAELAAAGIGSILVPFPHAVDDHQTQNAQYLVQANAAILIPQIEFTVNKLVQLLTDLSVNRKQLTMMASTARHLAIPNSAQMVVDYCLKICSP